MDMQTMRVGSANREVFYYRHGNGEPLVYLHHLLGMVGFEDALARLAKHYDVIAPYIPGWGPAKEQLSEIDEGPLDLVLHCCDVLDACGIEKAHVLGISVGGWIAAELAAIAPQRVDKLVLVNPLGLWLDDSDAADPFAQHPGWPSKILFAEPTGRENYLFAGRDKMDAHVEELLNLRAGAKFLWPIPDTGIGKRAPRIQAPTLIATSDKDVVVPPAYGPAWLARIANAQLTTIRDAGHIAQFDQSERFAQLVADFLQGESIAAVA